MLKLKVDMCCVDTVFAARSGRRDRGAGGGGSRGGPSRGGASRGGRGGIGRIGPMGGGGAPAARMSQPSAMRSVVGSYTAPLPMQSSGFSHGAHY